MKGRKTMKAIKVKKVDSSYFSETARDAGIYDHHYFEIFADGQKVGTLDLVDQLNEDNDICYIERIDIDNEYQGQGIGTEVLTNSLRDFGYYAVVVAPDNERAQSLYERIGEEYGGPADFDEVDFSYNDQGFGVYMI